MARGSRRSARARPRRRISGSSPCRTPRRPAPDRARSRLAAGGRRGVAVRRAGVTPASGSRSRPATASGSKARSGARPERPASAARRRCRSCSTRMAARPGRPTAASPRSSSCSFARDSPSSTSTSADRPATAATFRHANHDEWGHGDAHDMIDAARWAAEQPWSRRPPGDLRRLVRRLPGPVRPRRGAGPVASRASTCTATRRSLRASATATGRAASTSLARWARPTTPPAPSSTGVAHPSTARSGSRRRS